MGMGLKFQMGMGMKSLKWEGSGTINLFPHTSTVHAATAGTRRLQRRLTTVDVASSLSSLLFSFLSADEYTHSGEVSAIYTFSAE